MVFIDSNILIYAATDQDLRKKRIAAVVLENAMENSTGVISLQVLREFANVLYRKSDFPHETIRKMVDSFYRAFVCAEESKAILECGMEIKSKHGLQLYDALVVATAKAAGCDTVYSEDMGDGVSYEGVKVVDPFKESAPRNRRGRRT